MFKIPFHMNFCRARCTVNTYYQWFSACLARVITCDKNKWKLTLKVTDNPYLAACLKMAYSIITWIICLFVCVISVTFCQLWANWTSQREGIGYRGTRAIPYSFSNEPSGSFTCPVYSTDTWDLGLKSHPNDMVRRGIELTTRTCSPENGKHNATPVK